MQEEEEWAKVSAGTPSGEGAIYDATMGYQNLACCLELHGALRLVMTEGWNPMPCQSTNPSTYDLNHSVLRYFL